MGWRKTPWRQSLLQRNAFQRFRQVFQRQRRRGQSRLIVTRHSRCARMYYHPLATLVLFASAVFRIADACSSRSTPKPRPPSQSTRPNVTFPTFECPREYQSVFCLNGGRCFTVKIENDVIHSCECTEGFTGPRCEFKDLEGSYLPNREKVMIETASIAGGVTVAVLLIVIISIAIYVYVRRRKPSEKNETMERRLPFASTMPRRESNQTDLELGGRSHRLSNVSGTPATSSLLQESSMSMTKMSADSLDPTRSHPSPP